MSISTKNSRGNIFMHMHPLQRIAISLTLSVIIWFVMPHDEPVLIKIVSTWIAFSLAYLLMCWMILFKKSITEIKKTASKEDGSKPYVFLMILLSSFGSMVSVLLLLISQNSKTSDSGLFIPVTISGMMLSWAMVHTLYAFHYAHDYYSPDENTKTKSAGGLDFPGEDEPDYIDFAYFAFVIGCTFQVSDVEISSKKIRRMALTHQLISFALNTFVVALTINLIAGLSK